MTSYRGPVTPSSANDRVAEVPPNAGTGDFFDVPGETGSIFSERVLIVKQRMKVFEVKAEYSIDEQSGRPLAAVSDVDGSFAKWDFSGRRA